MARISGGALGKLSGGLGDLVTATWKGIQTIRVKPAKRKNRVQSLEQLQQQEKFKVVVQFLQPLTDLFNITLKKYANKKTEFNVAVRHTIENAVSGTYPNFTINWPLLQISKGNQLMISSATIAVNGTNLVFEWDGYDSPAHPEFADRVIMMVYAPALKRCLFDTTSTTKGMGTGSLSVAGFAGQQVHAYMAFMSPDRKTVSNTLYIGQRMV